MRLVNKTIVTAMALFFAFILGCTKNDDSTVILLGPENNIKDIDEVTSVLVDDSIVKLTDFYRNNVVDSIIPDGFLPPNIEGTYVVSPNICVASTNPIFNTFTPDTIRFYKQNNGIAYCRFREVDTVVYVRGYMNTDSLVGKFTAFFRLRYRKDIDMQYKIEKESGFIITGKVKYSKKAMRATEIDSMYVSEILISEKTPEGGSLPNDPGTMYISRDNDGVSKRID